MFKFGKISKISNDSTVAVTFPDEDTTELIPMLDTIDSPAVKDDVVVLFNDNNEAVVIGRLL